MRFKMPASARRAAAGCHLNSNLLAQLGTQNESTNFHQKKTPRVARPKGFLRANPFGSTHRHEGEKLLEDYHRNENVNRDF
jgi:hypothetical protein